MNTMNPADSTDSTTALVIQMYKPRDPDAPVSEGQKALLKRFGLRFRSSTTQGQASSRLHGYFTANPDEYLGYVAEKKRKAQEAWDELKRGYIALAASRSRETRRVPASEKQISFLMSVAFTRKDIHKGLKTEAAQLLNYGALGSFASELLDQVPARPQQGEQAEQAN